ncbi:MAG TPA: winged helix DNA-binding domain-containing protein [Vicinamibacterales bacterium]|nr:winged helix DNA-binding domain-containing protein [Vicinamibacterales bacterium]
MAWLGAVQAQEFGPAKWGLSLRLPETTTDTTLDTAFDAGRILRTHVMRPTWHFVAAADIRWMLDLTAPRVQRTISHYCRNLGLDGAACTRATSVFERALDGHSLTRPELSTHLERAGMRAKGLPLAMLTIFAELEGVICSGPRRGKNQTYAQLVTRAPGAKRLTRDEALAELTSRFFRSHGPATLRDFGWWSGLTMVDTKRGLEINRAKSGVVDGLTYWTVGNAPRPGRGDANVHLLPIYDEYLVSYRDRDAVPHGPKVVKSRSRESVTFQHALVIAGQVAGTWRMAKSADRAAINVFPLRTLTKLERGQVKQAAERYSRFIGTPVSASIAS